MSHGRILSIHDDEYHYKTYFGGYCFRWSVVDHWNRVPEELATLHSTTTFKHSLNSVHCLYLATSAWSMYDEVVIKLGFIYREGPALPSTPRSRLSFLSPRFWTLKGCVIHINYDALAFSIKHYAAGRYIWVIHTCTCMASVLSAIGEMTHTQVPYPYNRSSISPIVICVCACVCVCTVEGRWGGGRGAACEL